MAEAGVGAILGYIIGRTVDGKKIEIPISPVEPIEDFDVLFYSTTVQAGQSKEIAKIETETEKKTRILYIGHCWHANTKWKLETKGRASIQWQTQLGTPASLFCLNYQVPEESKVVIENNDIIDHDYTVVLVVSKGYTEAGGLNDADLCTNTFGYIITEKLVQSAYTARGEIVYENNGETPLWESQIVESDNFNDNSFNTAIWDTGASGGSGSISETNQGLEIVQASSAAGTWHERYVFTKNKFDFPLTAEVYMQLPTEGGSYDRCSQIILCPTKASASVADEQNIIGFRIRDTAGTYRYQFFKMVNGAYTVIKEESTVTDLDRVVKIEIDSTNVKVWLDGVVWQNTVAHGLNFTDAYVYLGHYTSRTTSKTVIFDDFKISGGLLGKLFAQLCMGFIEKVEAYVKNTGTSSQNLVLGFASEVDGAERFTKTISCPVDSVGAWRSVNVREWWGYDKCFIYVKSCGSLKVAYDEGKDYDEFVRGASKRALHGRLWIRLTMYGLAQGYLPVGGTVNNIAIPNTASSSVTGLVNVANNTELSLLTILGAGKVNRIFFKADHHLMEIRVFVDGVRVRFFTSEVYDTFAVFSGYGYQTSRNFAFINMLYYNVGGTCAIEVCLSFEFQKSFEIRAYNNNSGIPVNAGCAVIAQTLK